MDLKSLDLETPAFVKSSSFNTLTGTDAFPNSFTTLKKVIHHMGGIVYR
jgi:hypothetical protein